MIKLPRVVLDQPSCQPLGLSRPPKKKRFADANVSVAEKLQSAGIARKVEEGR